MRTNLDIMRAPASAYINLLRFRAATDGEGSEKLVWPTKGAIDDVRRPADSHARTTDESGRGLRVDWRRPEER
jgi:hypothetical protein